MKAPEWLSLFWANLLHNHLWQRMTKHTIAVGLAFTIVVIPAVSRAYGPSTFLCPMMTVFGHAGRRLGQMVEALIFILAGTFLGTGWATLGLYLSSLVYDFNSPAAYTIRAVFVLVAVIFHGYIRSHSPRLFLFVWLVLVSGFTILMGPHTDVNRMTVTNILYPVLTAFGVVFVVNITIFPEFSSAYLGKVTIETLSQTAATLKEATDWFIDPMVPRRPSSPEENPETAAAAGAADPEQGTDGGDSGSSMESASEPTLVARLAALTAAKGQIRSALGTCLETFEECTYELTYSFLAPRNLKQISNTDMTEMVRNVVTLISACESKFALVGHGEETSESESSPGDGTALEAGEVHLEVIDDVGEPPSDDGSASDEGLEMASGSKEHEKTTIDPSDRVFRFKPTREIASGDVELLELLLGRIREPIGDLQGQVSRAIDLVMVCLAYCYDVKKLPNGARAPKGILLEEIDIRLDVFENSIAAFDKSSTEALNKAASMEKEEFAHFDIMPRTETFLVSSVLLSFRQAAMMAAQMLKHARKLVEKRDARKGWRKIYLPKKMSWKKWLTLSGEEDARTLPQNARKEARMGQGTKPACKEGEDDDDGDDYEVVQINDRVRRKSKVLGTLDEEAPSKPIPAMSTPGRRQERSKPKQKSKPEKQSVTRKTKFLTSCREHTTDFIESVQHSEHLGYSLKLALAVFLVSFPAFYEPWNAWYTSSHANWAALQVVLVFEVAIGSSFWVYLIRVVGVVFGCFWGYVAFEAGGGTIPGLIAILVIGVIPSAYVQLGTPYVKAGMISIVSMSVVALATEQNTGTAVGNFLKRMAAFTAGGAIAILVEMVVYPVRARDQLVESLSSCVSQISHMEAAIAVGVEDPENLPNINSARVRRRFLRAKGKAQSALTAAETFLPFCLSEPRFKGSFKALEPIYKEIIYVLHQIIDRMDNMIALRKAYGSSALEDLNPHIHDHRRNVAASITLALFAVNEALTTKLPLPQYLPSCRLAQLRLVHRVREVIQRNSSSLSTLVGHIPTTSLSRSLPSTPQHSAVNLQHLSRPSLARDRSTISTHHLDEDTIRRATDPKVLSWNAASAGRMEIIEFLEELVDLTKLLVGVNAFRGGMLTRPSYLDYMRKLRLREQAALMPGGESLGGDGGYDLEVAVTGSTDGGGLVLSQSHNAPPTVRRRRRTTVGTRVEPSLGLAMVPPTTRRSLEGGTGRRVSASAADRTQGAQVRSELESLPASLQRVGTRIRQERDVARRMAATKQDDKVKEA